MSFLKLSSSQHTASYCSSSHSSCSSQSSQPDLVCNLCQADMSACEYASAPQCAECAEHMCTLCFAASVDGACFCTSCWKSTQAFKHLTKTLARGALTLRARKKWESSIRPGSYPDDWLFLDKAKEKAHKKVVTFRR